jgi:hypothetical protein
MRYQEGEQIPDKIDPHISDESLAFTVSLGLAIGVVLFLLARKGKQLWLQVWAGGLVLSSVTYLAYMLVK